MKRISIPLLRVLALALLFSIALPSLADQAFRDHRYDAFGVLPAGDDDILFIGNSITNMHEWWEAFGDANICNRGTSGGYVQEIIDHLGTIMQGTPKKVFLMIGTNDIGDGRSADYVISGIKELITRIHLLSPTTEIYAEGILPCASSDKRPAASIKAVNKAISEWCASSGLATYVDLWSQLRSGSTDYLNGAYTLDGLHLKVSGYKVWCNYIADLVGRGCTYPADQKDNVGSFGSSNSYGMRESAFGQSKVNAGDILIVGDEMIHGGEWHELLKSDKVKNRGTGWGFPGPTISNVNAEMKNILKGRADNEEPAVIALSVGAADCNSGSSAATMLNSYKALVKTVRGYAPNARLLLVSVLPNSNATLNTNNVVAFNDKLKELAATTDNCDYVDVYTPVAANRSDYMIGNYLYGLGYVAVANVLAPALGLNAVTMEEAETRYDRGEQRNDIAEQLYLADGFITSGAVTGDVLEALRSAMAAAQEMLADRTATADDYRVTLLTLRKALAACVTVNPEGYLINMTTGTFTAGSGNFRSKWESTSTSPHISFYCGPNNMNSSGNNLNIFSGTALSSVYTLSCSGGYLIDRFEFDATAAADGISIICADGAGTIDLPSGKKQHVSVTGIGRNATAFTLKGANKQVALTNFRVWLVADDGSPRSQFVTTTIADGQFAADAEWYFLTIAAGKYLLHDNGTAKSITLDAAYSVYTKPADDLEWCFTGNDEEGYRLYNRQAGPGKVLAAPGRITSSNDGDTWPVLVDADAILNGWCADWLFESTSVLGAANPAYFMYEKGHSSYKVNKRGNNFAFWVDGADGGSAVSVIRVATHEYVEPEPSVELFVTTGTPNYRIPAIACTRKGTLVAVGDYRYGGQDIGYGSVELRRRVSYDNGETWGSVLEFTHGKYATSPTPKYDAAYGDPCIVADRESDRILVMSCSGNTGFPNGTRQVHQGIARFYSTDEGESWSEPDNLQGEIYALFDKSTRGPIRSMFIGSGKIHQSRYVKVGQYYRLYCSALVKDVNGTNCNYVLYSDDFGDTWAVLGDINTPPIPSGADEPKAEELPDGSVICSSRLNGGRQLNIFTFTDAAKAEGSWGNCATSNASNKGVVAQDNSCNGEIMIVPAIRKSDSAKIYVALQSVPFGPARANVGIYYKELAEYDDFNTPANFAKNWDGRHQASSLGSAYSTMCMQADGRIAFFYEESTHGADYTLIYKPYTLETITDDAYSFDPDPDRYRFMSRYIDSEVDPFYSGSVRIVGAPDPDRRGEVDAAVEQFKANPTEETYRAIFAVMAQTALPLQPNDTWYALRNVGRGRYYLKNLAGKLTASSTLVASSATQHFRFLPVEEGSDRYWIQSAQGLKLIAPTGTDNRQLTLVSEPESAGIYTVESNPAGGSLLACQNPEGTNIYLYLNASCDKVLPFSAASASQWYIEETDYVATGLNPLMFDEEEGVMYDLVGRRVTQPERGIYVIKGQKVLVR